ncbi:MAG: Cys-tRNA(Pro) deacylase [Sporomusaceae bacterium]|nr:Cys-tRNA(Pro) deacylase [Sporomusaceae bacterium]
MKKTNAARLLDGLGIVYSLKEYDVDESDLGAEAVAAKVGMPAAQVFKTLVVRGDKTGVLLTCIPGDSELDLKKVAAVSGNKKAELVPLKDVRPLTGYIRGGVSPLGAKKHFPVLVDESAGQWPAIAVSAGVRGCQLILPAQQLAAAAGAKMADLIR